MHASATIEPVATAKLLAYCRAGFEVEAATDLERLAAHADRKIDVVPRAGSAYVVADVAQGSAMSNARGAPPPIFARSVIEGIGPIALPGDGARRDRVAPLVAAIDRLASESSRGPPWRTVWVEYPDTNEGKSLSKLARALENRLAGALQASLYPSARQRLHVFLVDGALAYVGASDAQSSRWPLGIPRLRRQAGTPSRSAAKLAEAFLVFLGDREHELVRAGMRAVDLGAAPGGWTWVLAQRGLRVDAVDNGPLKGEVARDPLVRHLRADGMTFRPKRAVDWLTCDIVEQPVRIADLCAQWIEQRLARRAVFNLKLPMKRRYDEVRRCEARMLERLSGTRAALVLRQLYHDREEVTGYLALND